MKKMLLNLSFSLMMISNVGCTESFVNNKHPREYVLELQKRADYLDIKLFNASAHELTSHGLFLVAGRGSAGLNLAITSLDKRKWYLCAMIEQVYPGEGRIAPGDFLDKRVNIDSLKRYYCLDPGKYIIRASFAIPRPSASPQIVAESAAISVNIK